MDDSMLDSVLTAGGARIWFDPSDTRGAAVSKSAGDVNPASTRLWRAAVELTNFRCVVDVGANYGEMLAAIDLSGADTVIAYEPNERVARALRRTATDLDHRIEVRAVALGSVPEATVHFNVHPTWSGKSRVVIDPSRASTEVPSTSLDHDVPTTPESLVVKIDVEGSELDVIAGMHRLMQESELVVIMLEILHMSVQQVSELTRTWPTYVLDHRTGDLVRLPTNSPLATGVLLHEGNVHRENAVLIAGRGAAGFIAARPALRRQAQSVAAEHEAAHDLEHRAMEREISRLRGELSRRSVQMALRLADRVPSWVPRPRRRDR